MSKSNAIVTWVCVMEDAYHAASIIGKVWKATLDT